MKRSMEQTPEPFSTVTTAASVPVAGPALQPEPQAAARVRPSLVAGERVQLVLAGGLWIVAAIVLGVRGAGWLVSAPWSLVLALTGVALGVLKARFLLDRVALGVARRIHDRGPGASVVGFLSVRSWVVVVIMMAGGHALRLTATPRPLLGVLYVAIATALVLASRAYWLVLGRGWSTLR
jgi:hypothetical protein